MNQSLFPLSEQLRASCIGDWRRKVLERIDQILNLPIAKPELTFMNPLNALEENFKGLLTRKNTCRAHAKRIHHGLALFHIEQEDHSSLRKLTAKLLSSFETG